MIDVFLVGALVAIPMALTAFVARLPDDVGSDPKGDDR